MSATAAKNKKTPPVAVTTDGAQSLQKEPTMHTVPRTATPTLASMLTIPQYEPDDRYPTGPCPTWCTNDHQVSAGAVAASRHTSEFYWLAKRDGTGVEYERGSMKPAMLSMHLEHHEGSATPSIVIRDNSAEAGASWPRDSQYNGMPIRFELGEALTLAQALVELVDVAQGLAVAPNVDIDPHLDEGMRYYDEHPDEWPEDELGPVPFIPVDDADQDQAAVNE